MRKVRTDSSTIFHCCVWRGCRNLESVRGKLLPDPGNHWSPQLPRYVPEKANPSGLAPVGVKWWRQGLLLTLSRRHLWQQLIPSGMVNQFLHNCTWGCLSAWSTPSSNSFLPSLFLLVSPLVILHHFWGNLWGMMQFGNWNLQRRYLTGTGMQPLWGL